MCRLHTFQQNDTPHYFNNISVLQFLIRIFRPLVEKGDLQTVTEPSLVVSHCSQLCNLHICSTHKTVAVYVTV
jgi:hypothetical protein